MSDNDVRRIVGEAASLIERLGHEKFLMYNMMTGHYCTVGAIRHVTGTRSDEYTRAVALVAEELRSQGWDDPRDQVYDNVFVDADQELRDYDLVTTWNDDDARTKDEVVQLLREVSQR